MKIAYAFSGKLIDKGLAEIKKINREDKRHAQEETIE